MPDERTPYWFHAKSHGWGWGLPARREGWVVLVVWLLIIVAGSAVLAGRNWSLFGGFMVLMVALLVGVCYAKGEPPRWR